MSHSYGVGSIIEYATFGGAIRRVRVECREDNIKNGRAGFDGELVSGPDAGQGVWGYDDQITRVVEAAPVEYVESCDVHEAGACYEGCPHAYREAL